ncbi:MAG: hypothetical protein OQK12_03845 [Motiliproteus sp.]|nr:hypothetical protein [Motiliproteus sp.]MCW9052997.1 hypothetical protein [Motiliproteus sp.]
MNYKICSRPLSTLTKGLIVLVALLGLSACKALPTQSQACTLPGGPDLTSAVGQAKDDLSGVCSYRYDDYFHQLLEIAKGDPKPENRRVFSDFLVWSQQQGLLSKRQAQDYYNRYFNLKFVAMQGDYNNCSSLCPNKKQVLRTMEQELVDKELGLLQISRDRTGYQRADRLLQETELVLEATCSACESEQ